MKKLMIMLCALIMTGVAWGQEVETPPPSSDSMDLVIPPNDINEIPLITSDKTITQDDLDKAIKKALKEREKEKFSLGAIIIKEQLNVYNNGSSKKRTCKVTDTIINKRDVKIDSVKVDLQEGLLEYIKVYLTDGTTYTNKNAPIGIIYTDKCYNDRLYNHTKSFYILFQDVLHVDTKKRFGFLPNNDTFTLSNKKEDSNKSRYLIKSGNINSLVNFATYTDLLGLLGDQPNSLVNFEANAKFYLSRHNWINRFVYFFPYIQPSLHYNKVDSKFDTVMIDSNKVNPTEIYRRYNYSVGIDLSVAKWDFRPSNSLELKAGYQYASSKIYTNKLTSTTDKISEAIEELKKDADADETRAVNHIIYLDLTLHSKVVENFGIELSTKHLWQTLNKSKYYDRTVGKMLGFRGGIYYFPPNGNGNDKIFIRFSNYVVFNKRELDFSQIQVGFSKALNFSSQK